MRLQRTLGTGVGLVAVAGILAVRAALGPAARRAVLKAQEDRPVTEPAIPTGPAGAAGRRVRVIRLTLAAAGLVVLLVGAWKVLNAVQPQSYVWLAAWLLGAILLSDAVIAPVVTVLRALAHRTMPRRGSALAWLKGGFVVAGVLVVVVVPEIWAQHLGTANPTILPGDYTSRLLVAIAVVGVIALTLALILGGLARRHVRGRATTEFATARDRAVPHDGDQVGTAST